MALKGADISATYQDWVHVNKAGAGLADHAGAEAALYLDDGAGGVDQILGRTAVPHWLDPHPDAAAFAETWEFSTKGTMTQAALETAGWTFENCTGAVSNGVLWLTTTGGAVYHRAYLTVNLTGDFDFLVAPVIYQRYGTASLLGVSNYLAVADSATDDKCHGVNLRRISDRYNFQPQYDGKWSDFTSFTGANLSALSWAQPVLRINRVSGTIYVNGGHGTHCSLVEDSTHPGSDAFMSAGSSIADATAMDRLCLASSHTTDVGNGFIVGFAFLRRFQ